MSCIYRPAVVIIDLAQRITAAGRDGLGEGAGLVFQQGQQEARGDAVIGGDDIHDLGPGVVVAFHIRAVILQPARTAGDESGGIETNGSRAIDVLAIGNDLLLRAPEGQVVDRDLHGHAGRHGGGIGRDLLVGSPDLGDAGIEMGRQSRERVTGLGDVIDQLAGVVLGAFWKGGESWGGGRGGGGGGRYERQITGSLWHTGDQ